MLPDEMVSRKVVLSQGQSSDIPETIPSPSRRANLWLLRVSLLLGVIALLYYFSWWLDEWLFRWPALILIFLLALLYAGMQLVSNWVLYLVVSRPRATPSYPALTTVDVFVTASGEPYAMVEACLSAACAMRGDHCTWLLDDGADPALALLADRLGAGYLTRTERTHAKAGNLNAALSRTKGKSFSGPASLPRHSNIWQQDWAWYPLRFRNSFPIRRLYVSPPTQLSSSTGHGRC